VVYDACREAIGERTTLIEALLKRRYIVDKLGEDRLRELTDPANYLGAAETMARGAASRPPRPKK